MKPEDLGAYYESILDKEARKEGGVYYTPPLIVDYMVENAIDTLLNDKTPKTVTVKTAEIILETPQLKGEK